MNWRVSTTKITCPCCLGAGEIEPRAPVPLSPNQFKIFDIVRRAKYGITGPVLTDRLYADRADGGPATGRKSMQVQVIQLNKRLVKANLRVGAKTMHGPYFLLQISGAEHAA